MNVKSCLTQLPKGLLSLPLEHYQVHPLNGGVGNGSYHIFPRKRAEQQTDHYLLRIHNPKLNFSVNRQLELACWQMAATIGRAPELLYWSKANDFSLSQFIDQSQAPQQVDPHQLLALIADLHQLPHPVDGPNYRDQIKKYWQQICWQTVAQRQIDLSFLNECRQAASEWISEMEQSLLPRCFCHHDLTRGNLLWHQQKWIAIDFEYAGLGHPLFELAALTETLTVPCQMNAFHRNYLSNAHCIDSEKEQLAWHSAQKTYIFTALLWTITSSVNANRVSSHGIHTEQLSAMSRYYQNKLQKLMT